MDINTVWFAIGIGLYVAALLSVLGFVETFIDIENKKKMRWYRIVVVFVLGVVGYLLIANNIN